MKNILGVLIMLFTVSAFSQSAEEDVKATVEKFFEGFHSRDSVVMKSVVSDQIHMQSISKNREGEVTLVQEDFGKFLRSIVAIPSEMNFREELHSFDIKVDGVMASVWTPYSLFVNDTFRHCGVNTFQLIKKNEKWEIIYLVDTRRREGCDQSRVD